MPYKNQQFEFGDYYRITLNQDFVWSYLQDWYNTGGGEVEWGVLKPYDEKKVYNYTKAIEELISEEAINEPISPFCWEWWWEHFHTLEGCPNGVEKYYKALFYQPEEIEAIKKIMDWYIISNEKRKINSANTIKKWWLKCNYDPQYKYCREKIWRQHLEICG